MGWVTTSVFEPQGKSTSSGYSLIYKHAASIAMQTRFIGILAGLKTCAVIMAVFSIPLFP